MAGAPPLPVRRADLRRPPLWSAIVVLILPFLPALATIVIYRIGVSSGCAVDGSGPCVVAGFDLADLVQKLLAASWLVIFGVWAPVLVATGIVHRAMDGFGPRMAAGGLLPAVVIVGSVIAPTIACAIIKPAACSMHALGPECSVFGLDSQQAFSLAAIQPWPLLLAAIPAALYLLIYLIVLTLATVADRGRARIEMRAAIAAAREAGLPPPPPGQFETREARPRKPLVYIPPKRKRPPVSSAP